MDTHLFKVSLVLVLAMMCVSVPHYVIGERIYIKTSPNQTCPSEYAREQCMTLQWYTATKNTSMTNTVTLELQPGTHTIGSRLSFSNAISFEIYGTNYSSIHCSQMNSSIFLQFTNISSVRIYDITFTSCGKVLIQLVAVLKLQSSIFEDHGHVILKHVQNATVSNSTFSNGQGLQVQSSLLNIKHSIFRNLTVDGNSSGGSPYAHGAAIWSNNSNISVLHSIFVNNTANTVTNSSSHSGAAIYYEGYHTSITIEDSEFMNNSAPQCAALQVKGYHNSSVIRIYNSTFSSNKANGRSMGATNYNKGGVACISGLNASIFDSSFLHNEAFGHAGVLHIEDSALFIGSSMFRNNSARGSGGVIYTAFSAVNVSVEQCLFQDNMAGKDGGVMYVERNDGQVTVRNTKFLGNRAGRRGGVIAIVGSKLDINNTTIAVNNTATAGSIISACMSDVSAPDGLSVRVDSSCDFNESTTAEVSTERPPPTTNTTPTMPPEKTVPYTVNTTPTMPPAMSMKNIFSTVGTTSNTPPSMSMKNVSPTPNTAPNTPPATSTKNVPSIAETTWNTPMTTDTNTMNEVSTKRPTSTTQNTPSIIPTTSTDSKNQDMRLSTVVYVTLGIAIFTNVLVLVLYIMLIFYGCGVCKDERGANRNVENPHVYVPLKENNTTVDNDVS